MVDFKNIPIKSIKADPNQPRKFFDEAALQELTDSVRINGILQPILVRPTGKDNYTLVCGERRYKAAWAVMAAYKDRNTIPAMIRELTDEQALELQIVENLQRKDVHPMEEAVAFKSLLDHKQYDVHEIAARVGKSDFYVRQRLKLNDLTNDWQKAFFASRVNLKAAMAICQLPGTAQVSLYKSKNMDRCQPGAMVIIEKWDLENYRGELSRASFDLEDHMLCPGKAGACTTCQFNTAVALLFPDEAKSPRCMNIECFEMKNEAHMARELNAAIDDPTVILVSDYYALQETGKKLKSQGHLVLNDSEYSSVRQPEGPDLEELREQYEDEIADGEKTDADIHQEFEELQEQYKREMEAYQKKIDTGKYKKAFMVEGYSSKGKCIYVTLKEKGNQKAAKTTIEAGGEVSTADIDAEIARLKGCEQRKQELDAEKVHKRVSDELTNFPGFYDAEAVLSDNEYVALGILVYQSSDYTTTGWLDKKLKLGYGHDTKKLHEKLVAMAPGDMKALVNKIIRRTILGKLITMADSPEKSGGAAAIRKLALDYVPAMVTIFDQEQADIAAKRKKKVDTRVAQLQKQKKDLEPSPAAKKKSSNKKS